MVVMALSSHHVDIFYNSNQNPNPICAGTLISSYLVLTVYSCLIGKNESELNVRPSARDGATHSSQIRTVDTIQSYPALRSDSKESDLAVILLDSSFNLDDSFTSIKVNEHDTEGDDLEGSTFLSQCGGQNVESECSTDVKNGSRVWICTPKSKSKSTGAPLSSSSACSLPLLGSGLVCEIRGIYMLCGALAMAAENGADEQMYIGISKYLHWIHLAFEMRPGGNCDAPDCYDAESDLAPTIFEGRDVSSSSPIPYQLSLQRKGKTSWKHICGAVIIDRETVLSAAHCFDGSFKRSAYRFVAGITRLDSNSSTRQILPLKRIIRHKNFFNVLAGDDIAVIHVNGSFSFNANVGSIWIPPPNEKTLAGLTGRASGWGQTVRNGAHSNLLQQVDMRILSDAECKEVWSFLKPSMLCIYDNISNTCSGDSGGPLVLKNYQLESSANTGRDALIGISSFSHKDCDKEMQPNGFTKVSLFYDWINERRASRYSPTAADKNCTYYESDTYIGEPEFTAVSSHFFRLGTDYKVFFTVNPHPDDEPLQLKCILMANSTQTIRIESDPISLRPGESGQISIPLPRKMPGNESVWRLFAWSFTEESEDDGYKYEAPHTLIYSSELANKNGQSLAKVDLASVFIQTDKPTYKQGDLVRIRVVTMGTDDLPHSTAGVNITITDSQGNVMKKWKQPLEIPESASAPSNVINNERVALYGEFQKKQNELSSYKYQLSGEPILGNWTIQVEAGNIKERMHFDVKKYLPPKFQVKVSVPPVLYGNGELSTTVTIQASYTSGKGLQGTGTVTVTSGYDGRTRIQQMVVKDGEAVVPISLRASPVNSSVHTITANVTEKNTGRWQIGSATVGTFPQETYNIEWMNKPSLHKPGLSITVQLKITGQDKLPVKEVRRNALRITFPSASKPIVKESSIPLTGIVTLTFPTPLQPLPAHSKLWVQYKRTTIEFTLPAAARGTCSGIFIEVLPPPDSINLLQGNSYNFTIRSNKPIQPEVFHFLLWNDAALDIFGAQTIFNHLREPAVAFPFSLQIPKAAYTNLQIFIYFEHKEKKGGNTEIISALKLIHTENYLKIRVSRPGTASAAELQVEPGESVQIHFETHPDSAIAIRGVDQSLFLLTEQGQDNELTQEKVQNKKASQFPHLHFDNIPPDNSSFLRALNPHGISVLNSKRFTSFLDLGATSAGSDLLEESEVEVDETAVFDYSRFSQVDSRLCTKFPETWLWEEFQSNSSSSTTVLSKTLPDTLTSWSISGFSLNSKTGLGVANPATITGFRPFFVTLNLPYSVIKDESFDLQVIVHNYLDRDVNVYVTLFNKDSSFSFIGSRQNEQGNETHRVKVQKNQVTLAHFVITPLVIGDIPIEVKVVTEDGTAGDSMIRPLKVKPNGVRETRTQLVMFSRSRRANVNMTREKSYEVEFPKRVVKGASSVQLTVVGDPMGTILSNLGNLLDVPCCTGESNMIKFVPNILVLHYLSATNSDATEIMQRARTLVELGYGRQLQYRRSDGSFAVWKSSDGLTWLTSYVLQWFVVAQKYITIDNNVIKGAVNFIQSKQQRDGSFVETGPVYHPQMRGQTNSQRVALTAYVTLALIKANETSNSDLNLTMAIENGMRFISRQSVYELDNNYITNLVAATLMAGDHPKKTRFYEKMEKAANTTTTKDGTKVKYWGMINQREGASDPLAIEMTSYALLAHLWRREKTDSSVFSIYRWLLNRQGPHGGFISTPDTVMGLTALTEFALKTVANVRYQDELQLNIQASSNSSAINYLEFSVTVTRWNWMVLQEFTLPASTKVVTVRATGSGAGLIQLTETWHVQVKDRPSRVTDGDFNITAKMSIPDPDDPSETELRVCVNSFHLNGAQDSIAAIELPSGYAFLVEEFEDGSEFMASNPENVQRFELSQGNTKLDVYYSYIQAHPRICITLSATRLIEVANAKKPPIHVYEYLNPARKTSIVYEPAHKITQCQLCRSKGACGMEECD